MHRERLSRVLGVRMQGLGEFGPKPWGGAFKVQGLGFRFFGAIGYCRV